MCRLDQLRAQSPTGNVSIEYIVSLCAPALVTVNFVIPKQGVNLLRLLLQPQPLPRGIISSSLDLQMRRVRMPGRILLLEAHSTETFLAAAADASSSFGSTGYYISYDELRVLHAYCLEASDDAVNLSATP